MSTDQENFDQLDKMAEKAYQDIQAARDWIDSLKDKAIFPNSCECISTQCDDLLNEIMLLVDSEKSELKTKEQEK